MALHREAADHDRVRCRPAWRPGTKSRRSREDGPAVLGLHRDSREGRLILPGPNSIPPDAHGFAPDGGHAQDAPPTPMARLFSAFDCRTHLASAARLITERRACIPGRRVSSVQHGNAAMPEPPATGDLASALAACRTALILADDRVDCRGLDVGGRSSFSVASTEPWGALTSLCLGLVGAPRARSAFVRRG